MTAGKPAKATKVESVVSIKRPRVLIEDWLPAAAIGIECIRERSTGQQPPDKRLHVWWARRPLTVSRAAVLASLLPVDFPRDVFERLLGFGQPSHELITIRRLMDQGIRVKGGFNCGRAFSSGLRQEDLDRAHAAFGTLWGSKIAVADPMAGGGSIPLEAARLGVRAIANEYNPVACSILEATVDHPFRFGAKLPELAAKWAKVWEEHCNKRLARFFPKKSFASVHAYIFARTVPCPETQNPTPLVPDWHLLKPSGHSACGPDCLIAVPEVDKSAGTWTVSIHRMGRGTRKGAPPPTYSGGSGISLFTGRAIPDDYIKAKAQQGLMKSALYAVALKAKGLEFRSPELEDLKALVEAEKELAQCREAWENSNILPTELYPEISSDERPRRYGMPRWTDMFTARQLLSAGVLVEELGRLRNKIVEAEGSDLGEAVILELAICLDKFLNHNCNQTRFESTHGVIKGKMDRHDYAFKATFAEYATCNAGAGLRWAVESCLESVESITNLPKHPHSRPVEVNFGSATNLPQIESGSLTAIVVDPPYADNVQYAEMADFFYVWLKRTQAHRRPAWFSTYLSERDKEAVVNVPRHRKTDEPAKVAKKRAHEFYKSIMCDSFREMHRILRDDGVLTVMFTHKKQEAWEALFRSLIDARFTITATWPVKTESEHSLHQAKKNAAQSTVVLVARKRPPGAGVGWFDSKMKERIRQRAESTAQRLEAEGLNPVDQLVGSFGPAIEVYSAFDEVKTDTGEPVGVDRAIAEASDSVSKWRIQKLAARGLDGVEPEGQFVLLCWDVLGAAEFRFNEAKLLGHAVDMDVERLAAVGLISKSGDRVKLMSARERRRDKAVESDETLFGPAGLGPGKRGSGKAGLRVHPSDPQFRTAIDACHAVALRYVETGEGAAGIGAAKSLARQHRWTRESPVARLMEALVAAAPLGVRQVIGKTSAAALYPEFRAWHALLKPLFEVDPPDWSVKPPPQTELSFMQAGAGSEVAAEEDEDGEQED
jgi:putative DNA methylase